MEYIPFFLIGFAILSFTFLRASKNAVQSQKDMSDSFWARERKANETRKKELTTLNYILFDDKKLPQIETSDTGIARYLTTLSDLSQQKILNLNGKTNTDLKIEYGRNHLQHLINCDANYIKLIQVLHLLGKRLETLNYIQEAMQVFQIEVEYESDIIDTYKTLYEYYKKQNDVEKLQALVEFSNKLDSNKKEKILGILQEVSS